MRITPLDVRKQEFRKAVRGLDADEVNAFLATVADEYEFVLTDNKKLREKVIELDEKVGEYRNMEKTLRDTLLTAERVMTEARQNARKEADLILRDAQMKASQEVAGISGRVEALHQQIRELRGHRDSYVARLQSLSEAQLGLIDSYRKDFENSDTRIDRSAEPAGEVVNQPVDEVRPQAASRPVPSVSASEDARAGARDATPSQNDEWRAYSLEAEAKSSRESATPSPIADAPQVPDPESAGWEGPSVTPTPDRRAGQETEQLEQASPPDHGARVASVADALSGAVRRVEDDSPSPAAQATIDEVSAALGMFTEESGPKQGLDPMEGKSSGLPPVGQDSAPSSPWPSNELAQDEIPMESVDLVGGPQGFADPTDASTESDEHDESEAGRWSLSRIARGLTGH